MITAEMPLKELYEADEVAWLDATAELIRFGNIEAIDFVNLEEFLTAMARSDRRAVISRFEVLLSHILKWLFQPTKRSRSWALTIKTQQRALLEEMKLKSLRNHALDEWENVYDASREFAMIETGLAISTFPEVSPLSLDQALSFNADTTGLED